MEGSKCFELVLGSCDDGKRVLSDLDDPFLVELQEFEIAARMKKQASLEEFLDFQVSNVIEWSKDDVMKINPMIENVVTLVSKFSFLTQSLPDKISVFLTTGKEEAAVERVPVAYCRGLSSIFISKSNVAEWLDDESKFQKLILHELWHILSRNLDPEKADEFYRIFGYERIIKKRGVYHPEELVPLKFTNPDAIYNSHYINVTSEDGETLPLVPLIFLTPHDISDADSSPIESMTLAFAVLKMEVDEPSEKLLCSWVTETPAPEDLPENISADEVQDVTVLIPPGDLPEDFWKQISRNTEYVIHVEEICAENFVLCVLGDDKCSDPTKVQAFKDLLLQ